MSVTGHEQLPSAVYLSPVQTPPPSNYGYFMFVFLFGVRQAQIFSCACLKRKRPTVHNMPLKNIAMGNSLYVADLNHGVGALLPSGGVVAPIHHGVVAPSTAQHFLAHNW